jgi:hypothetical protein
MGSKEDIVEVIFNIFKYSTSFPAADKPEYARDDQSVSR